MTERTPKILAVDAVPENVRLLEAVPGEPGLDGCAVLHASPRERRPSNASRDHGHVERRPGEEEGNRGRRQRLHTEATGGQVLIAKRLYAEVEQDIEVEPAGEFALKGFRRPAAAFDVVAVRSPMAELSRA